MKTSALEPFPQRNTNSSATFTRLIQYFCKGNQQIFLNKES